MHEKPREGAETPQEQYEALLAEGITAQRESEDQAMRDDTSRERQLDDRIEQLLAQRVELVRKMDHLKTIEDAFPRVKANVDGLRQKQEAEQLISIFDEGADVIGDAAITPRKLEEDEEDGFMAAREALATEFGYEVGDWGDAVLELRRNGVVFSLEHLPFPEPSGILGGRIARMSASMRSLSAPGGMNYYDGNWDVMCTQPEMQKEIDRVIAIFG